MISTCNYHLFFINVLSKSLYIGVGWRALWGSVAIFIASLNWWEWSRWIKANNVTNIFSHLIKGCEMLLQFRRESLELSGLINRKFLMLNLISCAHLLVRRCRRRMSNNCSTRFNRLNFFFQIWIFGITQSASSTHNSPMAVRIYWLQITNIVSREWSHWQLTYGISEI